MPLRLSMIDELVNDLYHYKVICSEQVDELWYEVVKVMYFLKYEDAIDAAQVWENRQ